MLVIYNGKTIKHSTRNIIVVENDYIKKIQVKILVCLYFFIKNLLIIYHLNTIICTYLLLRFGENVIKMYGKWQPKTSQVQSNQSKTNVNTNNKNTVSSAIPDEQKKELLDKLHAGQGELSIEEWDDFLLQLTDLGLITNSQHLESMGFLIPIPDMKSGSCIVTYEQRSDLYDAYLLKHWEGNPLDFIEKMDFYLYKQMLGAKLNHVGTTGIEKTRETYRKISGIVQELLA